MGPSLLAQSGPRVAVTVLQLSEEGPACVPSQIAVQGGSAVRTACRCLGLKWTVNLPK